MYHIFCLQPATHFLLGHLLWATRNYTGAAHHYQEALAADQNYPGALDTLRAMKCYLKYHYAAQSAVPQESPANSHSNCQQKPAEAESRVICKTVSSVFIQKEKNYSLDVEFRNACIEL